MDKQKPQRCYMTVKGGGGVTHAETLEQKTKQPHPSPMNDRPLQPERSDGSPPHTFGAGFTLCLNLQLHHPYLFLAETGWTRCAFQ